MSLPTKSRVIVSAVLLAADDKILMGKVREGGVYPDCWHIPGGGVDGAETKEQALVREIKEEVGIDITGLLFQLLSDTDTGEAIKTDKVTGAQMLVKMQFNTYLVALEKPSATINVSLDDDLSEYIWAAKTDLGKYKLTPPSQKLFAKLGWV